MANPLLEIFLLLVAVGSALASVESRSLVRAIFGLLFFTLSLGFLFLEIGAPHVGIFQILVYSGGLVALFLAVIMLTKRREEG